MTQTEKSITWNLAILWFGVIILVMWMAIAAGPVPEGIRVSTIDIGETIRTYIGLT